MTGPAGRPVPPDAREAADIAALADPAAWAPAAGRLMADLGFSLIHSDHPGAPGGSILLVALRDVPTLHHFDPEAVTYWAPVEGRGRIAQLDRTTELPLETRVSWGSIRVVDRLGEDNRFLAFGGTLRAVALDPALTVAAISSPGPLPRWSGHSQGVDPIAAEVGAFFGRLMVPVDFASGAEGLLAEAPPLTLFAAFVRDGYDRFAHAIPLRTAEGGFADWVAKEASRLEAHEPAAWSAAGSLLASLSLAGRG